MSNKQYSESTIEELKKIFVFSSEGLLFLPHNNSKQSDGLLVSEAARIEGTNLHSSWGKEYNGYYCALREQLNYVVGTEYRPSEPLLIPVANGKFVLNTYKAPTIERNLGEVSDLMQFFKRLFPVDSEREYAIALIAHWIIRPEVKTKVTLLLRSEQGVGKGVLTDCLIRPLVGESNFIKIALRDANSKFNSFLGDKVVVAIDEVYEGKKKSSDSLKTKQTDDYISVEEKGEDRKSVKNYSNFIVSSNDSVPVYIERGKDRRWFVPTFIKHKESKEETQLFCEKFIKWLDNGGLEYAYDYFHFVDIEKHNFNIAPDTEDKNKIAFDDLRDDFKDELNTLLRSGHEAFSLTELCEMFKGKLNQPMIRDALITNGYNKPSNASIYEGQRKRWWTKPSLTAVN
ncbi:primase-helicase family protein [Thalassotalea crassostreae]|uniref:primase-helicase family protein n=1 Tax=Thalassotalea crassostreae TaxID=1763536 RepID=UPI000838E687|nr:DUF5906 domain-containing protein [Thalassotalea crassostreae]